MKIAANIVGALLGFMFIVFGLNFFLHFINMPPPDPATPAGQFMAATGPTGWMAFVHALEILSGLLIVIPKTRILGLLILCPIIVNILCFHIFLTHGGGLVPVPIVVTLLAAFLLWSKRAFFALMFRL